MSTSIPGPTVMQVVNVDSVTIPAHRYVDVGVAGDISTAEAAKLTPHGVGTMPIMQVTGASEHKAGVTISPIEPGASGLVVTHGLALVETDGGVDYGELVSCLATSGNEGKATGASEGSDDALGRAATVDAVLSGASTINQGPDYGTDTRTYSWVLVDIGTGAGISDNTTDA